MVRLRVIAGLMLATAVAHAQPDPHDDAPPLAQIRDEKQLAQALATITQDPTVKVTDDKARALAAALMTEGVRQLQSQSYDQALANFLEAYNKLPSPKILLNVASTLRDMGRLAEAANTYQRYLADPMTGPERVAEVKAIMVQLDAELTILTARVTPRGSDISIDGGPFITVGSALVTRVRPGIHLVRVKNGLATGELTVNGFEGESKDIAVTAVATVSQGNDAAPPPAPVPAAAAAPEKVDGWMVVGTQFATSDPTSNQRTVRTGYAGPELAAIVPEYSVNDEGEVTVETPRRKIASGVVGTMRIDGKGRGIAGMIGFALSPSDMLEIELAGMKSNVWGAYAGVRLRFLTGWVRPYAAGGLPMFFFENETDMQNAIAFGVRGAGGIELRINGHVSLQGDLGFEHFFNVEDKLVDGKRPDATVFVPTLGVIGRL
ncbi:MAG: tetratricopeptide repeat protein [Kofleriaceae bacterium]|nr:tetratricopeptide repeat protein [Kofleriaceae bacterium]